MKKYLIILLFSVIFLCLASVTVGAETTLDVAEQYIQRMQFYEQANEKAAPVSSTEAGIEAVNNANGALVYSQTDLSLPGKNGLDVDITRELNSSLEDYEYLTIVPIKDSYSKKTTDKYIYKYFVENDTSRPVFIAYDTPQAMFEKENGTNTILVSPNYTSYIKYLDTHTDRLSYEIGSSAIALGVTFDSAIYYANDLPEGNVTLYRDLNSGCGEIYIASKHAYGFSTRDVAYSSFVADNWDTRPPSIQYTPTRAEVWGPDGEHFYLFYGNLYFPDSSTLKYYCINGIVYDRWDDVVTAPEAGEYRTKMNGNGDRMIVTGDYIVNADTQETFRLNIVDIRRECTWAFVDRGIFYDSLNGMALDYKLEYWMNFTGSIEEGISCFVYNYLPDSPGNGEYHSQRSDMYSLQMQQKWADDDMVLTFKRYDGTTFEFVISRNSAALTDGSTNVINANMSLQTIPVSKVSDNYGNAIKYNIRFDDIQITDTFNREINIKPSGIYVNGENVVSYTMSTENDSVIDPNNMMDEDNADVLTVSYPDTGKEYKYYVKHYMDTYLMGGKNEGDNPFDLTKSTSVRKLIAVELPTGGRINYEYAGSMDPVPMQSPIQKSTYKLVKRYETVSGSSDEINPIYYTHDHSDTDARKTIIHKGEPDLYSVTETYNEEGYLTENIVTSTDSDNAYYTKTSYIYEQQNEGNFLPVTETKTVKASSSALNAQITIIESEYNKCQQLMAQKRDGEYILENAYNSTYGVPTVSLQKRDGELWVGTINNLTDDFKDIAVSYAAEREGVGVEWQKYEGTSYTYLSTGDISSVTQNGVTTNYTYAYANYANAATAAKANSVTKTAQISNVSSIADDNAAGSNTQNLITSETYDWLGRLITATDANQNTTTYEYDNAGRITKQTNPDATTITTEYDDTNNTIITTAEDGAKQKLAYDPIGRDSAGYVYHAETQNWLKMYENSYDSQSRLSARKVYNDDGTEKSRITYTYFSDSQPNSETVIEGNTVLSKKEYTYAPYNGTNESAVSAKVYSSDNGYLTATQHTDKYGYRTKDTVSYDAVTNTQSYTTDLLGNILTVKDFKANAEGASSPTATYAYDYANRRTQATTMAGTVTSSYDTYGRLASETDARGNSTYYTYNAAGWVTQVRAPMDNAEEAITNTYYDANGNVSRTEVKQEGTKYNVTKNLYDSRNRLIAAVGEDASGSVITKYEYDDAGRITKQAVGIENVNDEINSEAHKVTSYSYDSLGRLVSSTDPLGQQSTFQYSILGELLSETDRNGVVKTYDYDGLGRLKELSADGGAEVVSYVYDLMGNITQMVDGEGTTAYTYSKKGELLNETRSGVTNNYSYDANGNRGTFSIPAMGVSATYVYDAIGRMTRFTDSGVTTNYTYDGNGNLLSETTDGGRTVTYSYNKANLLTSKTNKMGANTLETYALTYYADGNVKSVTENGEVKSYTYDGIGRLTKETTADAVTQYAYDKYNNRTGKQVYDSQNALQSEVDYIYDKNNRLTEIVEEAGDATYYTELSYDKNGNRIMAMLSGSTAASGGETPSFGISGSSPYVATYSYDVLGRMTSMAQGDTAASYTYDGAGLRQSKTVNGVTTSFVLDGMYIAAETSGGTSTYYSRGANLISRSTGGSKDYYYMNSHGDVTKLVNGSGSVVADYAYDAFGNQTGEQADTNPFRYCGEYFDDESGLLYLRARYYDPALGSFTQEDPAKDGGNWYAYCGGNPVNFWDPTGNIREGYYDEKGNYHANPDAEEFGAVSDTYKILADLGNRWRNASEQDRKSIENLANEVRRLAREGTPVQYAQDKVMNQLHENATKASAYSDIEPSRKAAFLIDRAYGEWDYKWNSNWQVPYSTFNGNNMNVDNNKNWRGWMYFDGMLMSADDFGNLNMAYVGVKMGMPNWVYQNFATTDGKDAFWVQYGIDMANQGR